MPFQWSNPGGRAVLLASCLGRAVHGASFALRVPTSRPFSPSAATRVASPGYVTSDARVPGIEDLGTWPRTLALAQSIAKDPTNSSASDDYNREHPWDRVTPWEEDKGWYWFSIEATIGLTWVTMVAAMPFIVIKLEGKDFTRAQAVVFFIMWVILFGGVYLFTQILYFQSAHFDSIRHLTVVESVYFLAQVLTTVGYGDITPAMPRAQVFVALYVLFSLLVIANVISEVGACISKHVRRVGHEVMMRYRQAQELAQDLGDRITGGEGGDTTSQEVEDAKVNPRVKKRQRLAGYFDLKPPGLDFLSVVGAIFQFAFFVFLGVFFYHNYPGEDKTTFDAIYMSVITLSTVGFGVVTPQTEAGKVFGAFWMLFGSGALVGLIGSMTDLYDQVKTREKWNQRDIKKEKQDFLDSFPEELDKYDFFKKSLLYKGVIQEEDLQALELIYEHLHSMKKREDDKVEKAAFVDLLATPTEGGSPR